MSDNTTIHVQSDDVEQLDNYAVDRFGSESVPYRVVIQSLLADAQGGSEGGEPQ